ncbi:MAG: hypothetical protein K5863_09170 [Nitratireductor sp.]|uniref:hypothetical protein n=1 Tax=Nitratireductor sp. TaxID=1872084 RepID=UPI00262CEC64|nr:hypothetical protein [Nitratireductor sp.]MCV0350235.1 hypothetical protein [Nitratireductor sp.]
MVYRVDVLICGTAYIQASSPEEAQAVLDKYHQTEANEFISELRLDDPNLPELSLSPAMTLYGKFSDDTPMEEAQ